MGNRRAGDIVYTPDWCSADMVRYFKPEGRILEPCRGGGAFTRHLPKNAFYCELTEGRDFFNWSRKVDWIITNPPYSKLTEFLLHSMTVAENVVFLVPPRKLFGAGRTLTSIREYGGVFAIRWYGGGSRLGFMMGNPVAAIHFRRDHRSGYILESFYNGPR